MRKEQQRREEQRQEQYRQEQQHIRNQLSIEQQKEREKKALRREQERQAEIRREQERQAELRRQAERERQAVLSKLRTSLSSTQVVNKEEKLNFSSEDKSTHYFDTIQTQQQDTHVFVHDGSPLINWSDQADYITDEYDSDAESDVERFPYDTNNNLRNGQYSSDHYLPTPFLSSRRESTSSLDSLNSMLEEENGTDTAVSPSYNQSRSAPTGLTDTDRRGSTSSLDSLNSMLEEENGTDISANYKHNQARSAPTGLTDTDRRGSTSSLDSLNSMLEEENGTEISANYKHNQSRSAPTGLTDTDRRGSTSSLDSLNSMLEEENGTDISANYRHNQARSAPTGFTDTDRRGSTSSLDSLNSMLEEENGTDISANYRHNQARSAPTGLTDTDRRESTSSLDSLNSMLEEENDTDTAVSPSHNQSRSASTGLTDTDRRGSTSSLDSFNSILEEESDTDVSANYRHNQARRAPVGLTHTNRQGSNQLSCAIPFVLPDTPADWPLITNATHDTANIIAPPSSVTIDTPSSATTAASGPTITEIILSHFTDHLSPEEQADFHQKVGKDIQTKLPQADLSLQQSILCYVVNGSNLYDHILASYPVSEWIRQSLIKDVVAFPQESVDPFLLERFRKSWSEIAKQYNSNQQEILLYVLKEQKLLHAFSLLQVNDLLDLVLATGLDGYGTLCSQEENWFEDLKTLWLTPQIKKLSFSEEDQNELCAALVDLPWTTLVTKQFLKAIKEEKEVDPILNFLSVVRDKSVADSVVLTTIQMCGALSTPGNESKQWTHALSYHLLYNAIYQLSPQLASSIDGSLFKILQSTCSASLLETFITEQIDLLNQHPAAFAKVLDQLYDYQSTEIICSAAFQQLPNLPVTDWPSKIDQLIVSHLFEASHEYTVAELAHHIADKAPNVAFTQKENLTRHYESIFQSYNAPARSFELQKVHVGSGATATTFDRFALNHPDLSLSNSSSKKLKSKPISQWNKQEVQLWSDYIKPTTETKLSSPVPQSELIAVVQRAVVLQHGFLPRATQLLSVLALLNPADAGRLAQINTGEGKSLIVAMLAAIHALEGKQVDVITTSTELSIPEVKKQQPFFELLSLTVGENSQKSNKHLAYKSDILYGIAGDFQGDILRTEFLGKDCRGGRKFQTVIVDEVDSMLFDNRSHSVRLAEESPGMSHLEVPLGAIWEYLHRTARRLIDHDGQIFFIPEDFEIVGKEIQLLSGHPWESCAISVKDKREFLTDNAQKYLELVMRDLTAEEQAEYQAYQKANSRITALEVDLSNTTNAAQKEAKALESKKLSDELKRMNWCKRPPIIDIPVHLRSFARSQIPYWIKNALNAAYAYKKDAHYAVVNDRIVPVHYNETGVLQSNMIWSDGLTQFLQLKEGLSIDPEGVSTNFISNVSFFKRYGQSIYGLTGTLGEQSTHNFLNEMYGTDMVVIPPYKQQKITNNDHTHYLCKELAPIVVADQPDWYKSIADQALYHASNQRGVLIICKYISQVNYLFKALSKQHDPAKVFSYTGQEATFDKSDIASGEIIVATNIAGRGTDFKTSKEVEASGGMYVAVTFLPESYRVEMQNVGRTGREGKKGMAQLIVHDPAGSDMQVMKQLRNEQEATSTNNALNDAKKVLVQDALFQHFCDVENQCLPTINECEKFQHWKRIFTHWDNYAAVKLTPQKVAEQSNQWVAKTKQHLIDTALGTLSSSEKNKLTSSDIYNLHAEAGQKAASERSAFEQRYKDQVLDCFWSSQPEDTPEEFLTCLKQRQPFQPNYSELARKYNWGEYERKGAEETWGFWLKEQHLEEKEITIPAAITDFESSFVSPFKDKAAKDQLVHNPYFYVLKGNDHLVLGVLYDAISCYNRSISMDPTFSVNARYNKAQALLLYEKNAGQRQQVALQELKKAKEIIVGTYKPALMTFNALIAQNGCKIKTSQHVQHQLNILSEQENYIVKACDIIEKAQIKKHHVKLTPKTLKESFEQAEEKHDKAIREATVNGLTNFFTVEEVIPTPWWSIISVALIGLAQMAAGFLIVACTAGSLGSGLISEGISDLITAVKSSITGSFSWAAWATQKAVSLLVSLISVGYGALKSGWQSVTNTVKDLVGKTAVGISKDGIKLAGKEVAVALGKGAAKELLMTAGQFCTNKLFMEDLEKEIAQRVGKALTDALLTNPLVVDALQSDQKNGNSCWQQLFIKEGLSLLKEKKEHKCLEMLRDISLGVAKNTIPLCGEFLQVAGVGKMLYELNNYTDDFIAKFNARVSSHQNDIIAAKSSAATAQANRETIQFQETVTSAAPPIDLEEGDVEVHTLEEGTTYRSKIDEEKTQLQSTYNNLGPSTPSSLANQFKSQIANKLTGSIKTNLVNPALNYAATSMTNKFFKETDKSIAILKNKVKTDRDCRHNSNEVANAANNRIQEKSKAKEGAEAKNAKKTPEKEKVPLDESAEAAIERAKNGEIKDGTDLGVLSNVAEAPIYVYGEDGKLKYVVGDALPGEPILIKHTAPTAENPHGHFAPMNSNIQVEPSGSSNCAMDAILPQLSESKRAELKDVNGLKEKMIEVILDNPKEANAAYKSRDQLATIAPDKVISGGAALSTAAKIGMAGEAWLKNHPEIMDLINKGIDLTNIFVVLRTAPALAVIALESPVIFGAIAATTAIAYKLVHKVYNKIIEETGINTPATQAKIAAYLQTKDEDLTHEQALFLADASTALMEKIGSLAVSYGVGKGTQVFSKKLLKNEVKNRNKDQNQTESKVEEVDNSKKVIKREDLTKEYNLPKAQNFELTNPKNIESFSQEIKNFNKCTDGKGVLLNGDPSSILNTASYYTKKQEQASAIFYGINKNHVFNNGNKRTSIAALKSFSERNNLAIRLSDKQLLDIATEINTENMNDISKLATEIFVD